MRPTHQQTLFQISARVKPLCVILNFVTTQIFWYSDDHRETFLLDLEDFVDS